MKDNYAALSAVAIFCVFMAIWSFKIKAKCVQINEVLDTRIEIAEKYINK
jgi:hypothetical protein